RLGSFEGQGGLQNVTDDRLLLQNQIFGAANEPGAKKVRILGKTKPSKVFQVNTPILGLNISNLCVRHVPAHQGLWNVGLACNAVKGPWAKHCAPITASSIVSSVVLMRRIRGSRAAQR